MPQIISLRELKNPSKISKMCHESDAPIFVTKNGDREINQYTDRINTTIENSTT